MFHQKGNVRQPFLQWRQLDGKDFDFFVVDVEAAYNSPSLSFANAALRMVEALQVAFPHKKVLIYANRPDYDRLLRQYTPAVDDIPLWIAQYPWRSWLSDFFSNFKEWWYNLFILGEKRPVLPKSRGEDDWTLWQVIDASGLGREFGFDSDELDFNVSRLLKGDFIDWVGIPERWENYQPPNTEEPTEDDFMSNELKQELSLALMRAEDALASAAEALGDAALILAGDVEPTPEPEPEPEPPAPEFPWSGWQSKPRSEWPVSVNGRPVGYVFVAEATPLQVLNKDGTFSPYESTELRGSTDTNGKRIIVKPGHPIMVWAKGNQYADVVNSVIRPFSSFGGVKFDGNRFAFLVMREQEKDGIKLWEGIPGDVEGNILELWVPYDKVSEVFDPVG